MIGYAKDHSEKVYRMLNLTTHRVSTSRDIHWLNITYKEYMKRTHEEISEDTCSSVNIQEESTNNDASTMSSSKAVSKDSSNSSSNTQTSIHQGLLIQAYISLSYWIHLHALGAKVNIYQNKSQEQKQNTSYNLRSRGRVEGEFNLECDGTDIVSIDEFAYKVYLDHQKEIDNMEAEFLYHSAVESGYNEPKTYKAMMKLPEEERNKWLAGVEKELKNMESRKVWVIIKKKDIPENRILIGTKWVFKIKRNELYRSRIVALGYTQIPGIDFTDNFSPVVSDITLRVMLVFWMVIDLDIDQLDVETAFLEGILEPHEYVYLKCPDGMKLQPDECLEVRKGLYGLVTSARIFWKRFSNHLTSDKVGFEQSLTDQCLFYKRGKFGMIVLLLYVDDSLCIGHRQDIDDTIQLIKIVFTITVEGGVNDFLGCSILRRGKDPICWLHQPHLIKKLREKFTQHIGKKKVKLTPGTPRKIIKRCKEDDPTILNKEMQELYQSGVGSLLYLLKHSRPELSNPVRELSKAMGRANQDALMELYRVINWVLNTSEIAFYINSHWLRDILGKIIRYMGGKSDSSWGSDPDDGRSVGGQTTYFMGVPVSCQSKTQSYVAVSSSEAEYVSVSELVKDIMYVKAIHIARNNTGGVGSRHVNYRYNFCREVHGTLIQLHFVRSEDNEADILTKNPTKAEHEKHATKFVSAIPDYLLH